MDTTVPRGKPGPTQTLLTLLPTQLPSSSDASRESRRALRSQHIGPIESSGQKSTPKVGSDLPKLTQLRVLNPQTLMRCRLLLAHTVGKMLGQPPASPETHSGLEVSGWQRRGSQPAVKTARLL